MRPKLVFAPFETKGIITARTYDLPLFEDIDLVRKYLIQNNKKLAGRKITWSESDDPRYIDEYVAQQAIVKN